MVFKVSLKLVIAESMKYALKINNEKFYIKMNNKIIS